MRETQAHLGPSMLRKLAALGSTTVQKMFNAFGNKKCSTEAKGRSTAANVCQSIAIASLGKF